MATLLSEKLLLSRAGEAAEAAIVPVDVKPLSTRHRHDAGGRPVLEH